MLERTAIDAQTSPCPEGQWEAPLSLLETPPWPSRVAGQPSWFIPSLGEWHILDPSITTPLCPATPQPSLCRWHCVTSEFHHHLDCGLRHPRRGNTGQLSGKHWGKMSVRISCQQLLHPWLLGGLSCMSLIRFQPTRADGAQAGECVLQGP